ncbi:unnamed protein product [marine sediment metagenome]|uniref:Uncharacterized protein n=1 Tax=marine sediment metagenome TaxID=412755 RepID=X0UAD7_9ZZZZ
MIQVRKGKLKRKEESELTIFISDLSDIYSDFYITRNNLRLYIKENTDLLYNCLEKGDQIAFSEEKGIAFITGFSDKAKRKYLKVLPKDGQSVDHLLKALLWQVDYDLFAKIKKNNPIRQILQRNNFKFIGDRGKEVLLLRKYIPTTPKKELSPKGDENDNRIR